MQRMDVTQLVIIVDTEEGTEAENSAEKFLLHNHFLGDSHCYRYVFLMHWEG